MKAYTKIFIALAASTYFIWCALDPGAWHFIDSVNLFIHEGGHIVFWPFGKFMHVLGGSLMQILLPCLFVAYFYWKQDNFSAALVLFWVGENLLNVSWYAKDALRMQLPLLFGDESIHDWNWLLVYTGQLRHTYVIANTILTFGIITIIVATCWSVILSIRTSEQ